MELFWKAVAAVILTVVLTLTLGNQGKQFAVLLSIVVCCMICAIAMEYLSPLKELLHQLERLSNLQGGMLEIMLKSVGIGIMTEIVSMIAADSGNSSVSKAIQLLGSCVILWISVPVFQMFIDLLQKILGDL